MSGRAANPVRLECAVGERLAAYVATHPGSSMSSTANRLVDEGLRMVEHPNVVFRDGPTGRRAGLVGGPDVREIIRAVRSARAAEPESAEEEILALVDANSGVHSWLVRAAVRYWAPHPAEIDAEAAAEDAAEESRRRERQLSAGGR